MDKKHHQLKFNLLLFMGVLTCYFIYAASIEKSIEFKLIYIGVGALISIIGIYMPHLKPNNFIGIRTPWTLESDEVWKATHLLTGKIWVISGIILALIALGIEKKYFFTVFMGLILVITLIPMLYSYLKFKELNEGL
jgi:uncharacterized membrane protein